MNDRRLLQSELKRGLDVQSAFTAESNKEARAIFRRLIDENPEFAQAHSRLSYAMIISAVYFKADNLDKLVPKALAVAKRARSLDPTDGFGAFALGRAHLAAREYDAAEEQFLAAIDMQPDMAVAHCGLGDARAFSGLIDQAMPSFEAAIALGPGDPVRWA